MVLGEALKQLECLADEAWHAGIAAYRAGFEGAVTQIEGQKVVCIRGDTAAQRVIERDSEDARDAFELLRRTAHQAVVVHDEPLCVGGVAHRGKHVSQPEKVRFLGGETVAHSERPGHAQGVA